jgi:adenosylcobinamide-phosphate synthase
MGGAWIGSAVIVDGVGMGVIMVAKGRRDSAGSLAPGRAAVRLALANAAGLAAGALLDAALGDPARGHPVAGFGRFAAALERRVYAPDRATGLRYAAMALAPPVVLAAAASLATRRRPWARAGLTALTTWAVLGGASLRREARAMSAALTACDLAAGREILPRLCGRDPSGLDGSELARATVESVAENTSDAVVAPLVWGAVAGLPGLVGYRAVNTLDAMVGHRSARYGRFGTAAARLDDLANLGPARLSAALTVAVARRAGGSPWGGLRVWLRDGGRHPSPNAGQCEAAMAGALGVRLGGRNVYGGRAEERPVLGDGPAVRVRDIDRAVRISAAVEVLALGLTAGHLAAGPWRRALIRLLSSRSVESGAARARGAARPRGSAEPCAAQPEGVAESGAVRSGGRVDRRAASSGRRR